MKGNLIATSLIGTNESLRKNEFFRMIEIRIIGSLIAIDNRDKSRDCPLSSNNPVVSDNRRSDNRDLTVCFGCSKEQSHIHTTYVLVEKYSFICYKLN